MLLTPARASGPVDPRVVLRLKGDAGSLGLQGDMGPKGYRGEVGPMGHPGNHGLPGNAAMSGNNTTAATIKEEGTSH